MRIEYYFYSSAISRKTRWYPRGNRKYTSVLDIKEKLPNSMVKEFIHPPNSKSNLFVHIETKKKEIINYFEDILRKKKVDYIKTIYIEATRDEVDKYDYFYIDLTNLEWGKHIGYKFTRPTCNTFEACPFGAKITSPVTIKSKYILNLNLGKIIDIWYLGQRFIISKRLRSIFESVDVTGLKYDPCFVKTKVRESDEYKNQFYVAEIIPKAFEEADDIYLQKNYFCKKHLIILRYDGMTNRRRPHEAISQDDFQMINRVSVKGKEYYYRNPLWFISQKVLKILLDNKITDLIHRGIYIKDGLMPVPFEDCVKDKYHSYSQKSM